MATAEFSACANGRKFLAPDIYSAQYSSNVATPVFPIYEATSRSAHDKLRDINSSFHIRNNIWGRFGWLGIDCQLPPEVPTQIGGIDYRALVEPKVFIGATTFVFLRRAVAFVKH